MLLWTFMTPLLLTAAHMCRGECLWKLRHKHSKLNKVVNVCIVKLLPVRAAATAAVQRNQWRQILGTEISWKFNVSEKVTQSWFSWDIRHVSVTQVIWISLLCFFFFFYPVTQDNWSVFPVKLVHIQWCIEWVKRVMAFVTLDLHLCLCWGAGWKIRSVVWTFDTGLETIYVRNRSHNPAFGHRIICHCRVYRPQNYTHLWSKSRYCSVGVDTCSTALSPVRAVNQQSLVMSAVL